MTGKYLSSSPMKGEVLSPVRKSGHQSTVVGSYFSRIRNEVFRDELKSQAELGRAWHDLVTVMRDIKIVEEEYAKAIKRSEHLPLVLAGEEAKLLAEIQQIFDNEEDRVRARTQSLEDGKLARDILRVRGEIELLQQQRKLDGLKKVPVDDPTKSRSSKRVAAIRRIREERDEMIAQISGGRPESELSEDDRELINDIRLAADNEVKSFLEENRG